VADRLRQQCLQRYRCVVRSGDPGRDHLYGATLTLQIPDLQIANDPGMARWCGPGHCYPLCMVTPMRLDDTTAGVVSPEWPAT